jgi:hypothetical protein
VVFADPNCGYCKKFERDLLQVKDVTSTPSSTRFWAPDTTEKVAQHLVRQDSIRCGATGCSRTPRAAGFRQCDTGHLQRNVALGRKHRITGTPAMVFEDGTTKPGALGRHDRAAAGFGPIEELSGIVTSACRRANTARASRPGSSHEHRGECFEEAVFRLSTSRSTNAPGGG